VALEAQVGEGDTVNVSVKNGVIVIGPNRPTYSLEQLVAKINQELIDENDAYISLVAAGSPLGIAVVRSPRVAWLLTLDGQWEQCRVRVNEYGPARWLAIIGAENGNVPGTSGSPIVSEDGRAVGIVSVRDCGTRKIEGRAGDATRSGERAASLATDRAECLPCAGRGNAKVKRPETSKELTTYRLTSRPPFFRAAFGVWTATKTARQRSLASSDRCTAPRGSYQRRTIQ